MRDSDLDYDPVRIITRETRRSKKERQCSFCDKKINIGEQYVRVRYVEGGYSDRNMMIATIHAPWCYGYEDENDITP